MEQLLKNEVEALLKARQARNQTIGAFPEVQIPCFDVQDTTFDLVDCKSGRGPVVAAGTGTVTYVNTNHYALRFVEYDAYLSKYDQSNYSKGIGRCDYLAFDVDGRGDYFLLNELCEGAFQNKKTKGINELARTLQLLMKSATLKKAILNYRHKECYLSVREQLIVYWLLRVDVNN